MYNITQNDEDVKQNIVMVSHGVHDKFFSLDVAPPHENVLDKSLYQSIINCDNAKSLHNLIMKLMNPLNDPGRHLRNHQEYKLALINSLIKRVTIYPTIDMVEVVIQFIVNHQESITTENFLEICTVYVKMGYIHIIDTFLNQHIMRQFDFLGVWSQIIISAINYSWVDSIASYVLEGYVKSYICAVNGIGDVNILHTFPKVIRIIEYLMEVTMAKEYFLHAHSLLSFIINATYEENPKYILRFYVCQAALQRHYTVFKDETFLKIIVKYPRVLLRSFTAAAYMGNREFLKDLLEWITNNNVTFLNSDLKNISHYYANTLAEEDIPSYYKNINQHFGFNEAIVLSWIATKLQKGELTRSGRIFAYLAISDKNRDTLMLMCINNSGNIIDEELYGMIAPTHMRLDRILL